MNTIYVYVMDTLADWELGHLDQNCCRHTRLR